MTGGNKTPRSSIIKHRNMKLAIFMIYLFCISLVALSGYMMHIHQPGSGYVILGAIIIVGGITITSSQKE